jgi:hypothetical protein
LAGGNSVATAPGPEPSVASGAALWGTFAGAGCASIATGAAAGDNGDAGAAERFHIAQDGALGDFEFARQIAGRHAAVHLQLHQDGKQPLGAHGSFLSHEYDIRCQESARRLALCRSNSH